RREVHLLDSLGSACADLRQQIAKREQPLTASNLSLLSAFDRSEVVSQRHLEGVAESKLDNFVSCGTTRNTSRKCGRLASPKARGRILTRCGYYTQGIDCNRQDRRSQSDPSPPTLGIAGHTFSSRLFL